MLYEGSHERELHVSTPYEFLLGVPLPDCEVSGFDLDQLGPTLFCIE